MAKRNFERMTTSLRVNFSLNNEVNSGTITNLSNNGMFINTHMCLPLKSNFSVFIPLDDRVLDLPAKVRRLTKTGNDYDGMGVELLNPAPRYLELLNSIRNDNIKNSKSEKRTTSSFICKGCNYIAFQQAPTICPFCGSSIDHFDNNPESLKTLDDFDDIGDFEKKHFPVITLLKEYDSKRESRFTDVNVKVGVISHSMDIEDHITCIDFYLNEFNLNKECISRFQLNCRRLKPEATIRIDNATSGVLTVVNNCSAHGSWMADVKF